MCIYFGGTANFRFEMKCLLVLWCLLLSGSLFPVVSVDGLSCYECTGAETVEFCNITASIKSCEGQDICISQKIFNARDSTVTSTKNCISETECRRIERSNDAGCAQGRIQSHCTWCCSANFCNHDGLSEPPTAAAEQEQTTVNHVSRGTTPTPPGDEKCPTSDELTKTCLSQFRSGVESVMRGEGNSFSNFCRSIPEIYRCFFDATKSCASSVTSGQPTAGAALCHPLWEELRNICPSSCNESAAASCVLDVFEGIVSAFTNRSNSICQELTTKIRSGHECVSHSVSTCEDGRTISLVHSRLLKDLESTITKICPRLPTVDNTDNTSVHTNRVGLAPCQLQKAMTCISSAGSEVIRRRIENKSLENVCGQLASNMSSVRVETDSCVLVRRKRAILATEVVDNLLGKSCDSNTIDKIRCNTTAARLCIVDLLRLTKGNDVQKACDAVEPTKSCVRLKAEKCTDEERDSLNRTLSHVLQLVTDQCAQHFQCLSNETITVTEGGEPAVIKVRVTYPPKTICNIPGCLVFLDIIPDNRKAPNCRSRTPISQFLVSSGVDGVPPPGSTPFDLCSRHLTKDSWKEEQSFHLAAKVDLKYDNSQMRSVGIAMRKVVNGTTLVERRIICEHKVLVLDGDQPSTCQSATDPHIQTFDGRAYNNFLEGFFTLYRHRSFPYEVQTAFQRCVGGGATCSCAVAVRAGDSVFFVDKCRTKESQAAGVRPSTGGPPCRSKRVDCTQFAKAEMFYHDKVTPGFRVFNRGDSAFEVLLPHGTRVVIRGERWYNVYIYPSPFDRNRTEGLCGTYDGNPKNDLTLRNGQLYRESLSHRAEPPLDFSLDWRVPENQLLTKGVVAKQPFRLPVHCDCEVTGSSSSASSGDGSPKPLCSSSRILELCDFKTDGEITYKLPKGQQPTTTVEQKVVHVIQPNRKRKRQINKQTGDDSRNEEALKNYDFDLNPDQPEVTQTGNWTKESAIEFCRKSLLNESTAITNCLLHLNNFDPEFGLESCAEDLMYSGGTEFVDGSAEVLRSQCAEQLAANVSFYNTVDGGDISLEVEESLCIDDCGQRGICLRGRCFCEEGFGGSSCGVSLAEAPQSVALQNGGLCDRRRSNCSWSLVLGQTFLDTANLTCRLQEVELFENETGGVATDEDSVTVVGATFISSQQLLCPIADHRPSSYLVSVSNDGATFSEQCLFLSRDVECYDCQWNASNHALCRRKTDTCLVSGTCYTSGEESQSDPCLVCDPAESSTQLHRRTSTDCTNRTWLTVFIVVLAVLFCAIIVLMTYRQKTRTKKRSAVDQHQPPSEPERIPTSSKYLEKGPHTLQGHDNVAMEKIQE